MAQSTQTRILIAAAGLLALAAAWFFVSPLFIDRVVDEPLAERAALPSAAQIEAMSPAERDQAMQRLMAASAATESRVSEQMDAASGPVPVAVGMFADADAIHKGSGRATLYRLDDGQHLLRFEQFRVTNGPALVVLLAEHPAPASAGDVEQGYLKLDDLKGNVGSQNYPLPAGVDLDRYGSVVVWCELFDVLFSAAPLRIL